jgi:hypothetical protein
MKKMHQAGFSFLMLLVLVFVTGCCMPGQKSCGNACYDPADESCCNDNVYSGGYWKDCSGTCYNGRVKSCCLDRIYDNTVTSNCGGSCIDSSEQVCCNNSVLSPGWNCCHLRMHPDYPYVNGSLAGAVDCYKKMSDEVNAMQKSLR